MTETGFWWTHAGHLLTKPLIAAPLWWVAARVLPPWLAVSLALLLPAAYSLWRKNRLWPGCLRTQTGLVVRDEIADAYAAAIVVLPLAMDTMPLGYRLALGVAMLVFFVGSGLHRWGLP